MDSEDDLRPISSSYFYRLQDRYHVPELAHLHHYIENYEELTKEMRLSTVNGIPGIDYLPRKLINRMGRLNNYGSSQQLQDDVTTILYNFLSRGLDILKIINSNEVLSQSDIHLRNLFLKYNFHKQDRNKKSTITPERLYNCFPHLAARTICMDMVFESPIDTVIFVLSGFPTLSPACHLTSSFALLPQYEEDVDYRYMDIIKAMLLYHFELQLRQNIHNRNFIQRTCSERMDRIISEAKIIYESTHIKPNLRWFSYTAFFIRTLSFYGFHDYSVAASKFDKRFKDHLQVVEFTFKLRPGSGRTNKHVKEVSLEKIWHDQEYYEDYQVLFRHPPPTSPAQPIKKPRILF